MKAALLLARRALEVRAVTIRTAVAALICLGLGALIELTSFSAGHAESRPEVKCTLVLGFSQTADWYLAPVFRGDDPNQPAAAAIFESIVDGDRWQLMWTNGAGVNVYSDPNASAWTAPIISPCVEHSDRPERIVYMISGPFGTDVDAWAAEIEKALKNIRARFPSAKKIALQPVVGAPANAPGDECFLPDGKTRVRASWIATPVLAAIKTVAARHDDVVIGAATRLRSCNHYVDGLGHIADRTNLSGAATAAVDTGLFYADHDF